MAVERTTLGKGRIPKAGLKLIKDEKGQKKADEGLEFIRDKRGRKKAVIMPIRRYRELLELLEDMHDLAVIAERRNEPTSSWEEVKQRLRADGLLPDWAQPLCSERSPQIGQRDTPPCRPRN